MTDLSVQRWGGAWAVFRGQEPASGIISTFDLAQQRLDQMARARQHKQRPCLRCGTSFTSTGPGHRLCGNCRDYAATLSIV